VVAGAALAAAALVALAVVAFGGRRRSGPRSAPRRTT
jgi:hypothetical protein